MGLRWQLFDWTVLNYVSAAGGEASCALAPATLCPSYYIHSWFDMKYSIWVDTNSIHQANTLYYDNCRRKRLRDARVVAQCRNNYCKSVVNHASWSETDSFYLWLSQWLTRRWLIGGTFKVTADRTRSWAWQSMRCQRNCVTSHRPVRLNWHAPISVDSAHQGETQEALAYYYYYV